MPTPKEKGGKNKGNRCNVCNIMNRTSSNEAFPDPPFWVLFKIKNYVKDNLFEDEWYGNFICLVNMSASE